MKKAELKKLLKPMIKEGILSNIVAEVATGLGRPTLVEAKQHAPNPSQDNQAILREQQVAVEAHKKELLASINKDAYGGVNVFEGTAPLSSGGSVSKGPSAQGPLSDIEPNDPGVDISNIMERAGNRWAAHLK